MIKKIKIRQQKSEKLFKSNLGNFLVILIIFFVTTGWIYSGWPQIWQNPSIPQEVGKVLAGTATFETPGTNNWHSPVGVTSVDVECWGGGGAGGGSITNKDGAGGGGGGAYAKTTGISISADTDYDVVVGIAGVAVDGAAGGNGGDSYFDVGADVLAKGGTGGGEAISTGGVGGAGGTGSTGVTTYDGGAGGYGRDDNAGAGGPGGSSAGTSAVGNSGANPWTSSTGITAPTGGGDGGDGHPGIIGDGSPGIAPGGGGGGSAERVGAADASIGGNGAAGKCILNWTDPLVVSVYVKDATVAYGIVPLSGSKCSTTTGDTQYVVNDGTGTENFNILGADTTDWDIGTSSPGADIYVHRFSTTTGSYDWPAIDNTYVTLETGVAANGTSTVDFYIFMPSSDSSNFSPQSTNITIQAVEP